MPQLKQPTPAEVKAARLNAGLTRREAAELVHAVDERGRGQYRTWQNYELDVKSPEHRRIPLDRWDLFLIKTSDRRRRGRK